MRYHVINQYPFVRILIPYTLGLMLGNFFPVSLRQPVLLLLFVLTVLWLLYFFRASYSFRYRFLPGVGFILGMGLFGWQWWEYSSPAMEQNHVVNLTFQPEAFICNVLKHPVEKAKTFKVEANVVAVRDSTQWIPVVGRVIVYFKKGGDTVHAGDQVMCNVTLKRVPPPLNPGTFDYALYLSRKGVFHTAFVKEGQWNVVKRTQLNMLNNFAVTVRKTIMKQMREGGLAGREYAVASALLLGYDELLDDELRQAFSGAGAMHVLCVSGLHVGIIFAILSFVVYLPRHYQWARLIKLMIVLSGITAYAIITGLAPSVLRASVMFGLWAVGDAFERKTEVYNTLAASAFIILLVQPQMLFQVGFQLSYAAVLGIVSIYPVLKRWWTPSGKLMLWVYDLLLVSIAAQLGTLPLVLFYFHQFPVYFLITNLMVIPLAGLILCSGIGATVITTIGGPVVVWRIPVFLITWLNKGVLFIDHWPGAVIGDITLPGIQSLALGVVVVALVMVLYKRYRWIWVGIVSVLLLLIHGVLRDAAVNNQKYWVVYAMGNEQVVEMVWGREHLLLYDSLNASALKFNIEPEWVNKRMGTPYLVSMDQDTLLYKGPFPFWKYDQFVGFGDLVYMVISAQAVNTHVPHDVDVLIVHVNRLAAVTFDEITPRMKVIVTGYPSLYSQGIAKEVSVHFKSPIHWVQVGGAYRGEVLMSMNTGK